MVNIMFADVIIDIVNSRVDRPFSYRIPKEWKDKVKVGSPVLVPFGAGNTLRKGYVVSLKETSEVPPEKVKNIDSVVEKGLTVEEQLLSLASFMKHRYGGTFYQCLSVVMPAKSELTARKPRFIVFTGSEEDRAKAEKIAFDKKHFAKYRLLKAFQDRNEIPTVIATDRLNISNPTIASLEKQGLVRVVTRENRFEEDRSSKDAVFGAGKNVTLNEEQQNAVSEVLTGTTTGYLLFGVTGSGKTEVYIRLIEETLKTGKEAIVLIPEIALTYQTVMRFYDRFGERVDVVHSRLSKGEKAERFLRAKNGEIKVMIGPRSALFTPFQHLGLVIVDEFHEPSYQSDQVPKYDAVELALKRAELSRGKAVFGSASPLVETYKRALSGELTLITLRNRAVVLSALPAVSVVDMREELKRKNRSIFSNLLREKIAERLSKGEQMMLFLNRRGYSGAVSCRSCGKPVECPHCSVSLNFHRNGTLKCHLCGYERAMVKECPACGSKLIGTFGIGTEKVEELARETFPGIRTLRMDADTTAGKEGHREILEQFFRHEADLLIGTQMIVKGHDFPDVTLVGILAADLSLTVPDYRSAERTFQLLLQAEGRAGRREKPGECVIQTYNPDHYAVESAKKQDFEAFYAEEIKYRKQLKYPPEGAFLAARVSGANDGRTKAVTEELFRTVSASSVSGNVRFLGPAEESVKKVKDTYRYCFYIKGDTWEAVLRVKEITEEAFSGIASGEKIYLSFES